ncbi:MAG: DUF2809 domain-containing protein [Lachnospiraceae bacterium]|nr:DUF2809 domain-containing protein [Lachnospiraceae bacterium]
MKRKRTFYALLTIIFLLIEILIALFVHDRFIRPYVGDMLVVVVIYTFLRIWIPDKLKLLPLYVFLFAAGVEVLQYFEIVKILGVEDNTFLRILIGSTFDIKDIVCYGVGCGGIFLAERNSCIVFATLLDKNRWL